MTVAALIDELASSSFGARRAAQACKLAENWASDSRLRIIVSISGALSIAQQTSILAQLVAARLVRAVITTGAVITHSLSQEAGGLRRHVDSGESDDALAAAGLNRVFDTVESDANLNLIRQLVDELSHGGLTGPLGSSEIIRALGNSPRLDRAGLVSTANAVDVPIFVPALSDSELGLRLDQAMQHDAKWTYDAFRDLRLFSGWLREGDDFALLFLGGGVPRNWAQQMFAEVNDHGRTSGPRLIAGIRVCPDPDMLGHLSGSTFSEARSWRKIPAYDAEHFVEVAADFTLVFPLIAISMLRHVTP